MQRGPVLIVLLCGGDKSSQSRDIEQARALAARARNLSQLARDAGMSRQGLDKALSARGNPSLATVVKVAQALGLRLAFKSA